MSQPITPLIALVGDPGAACEGDDCLPALPAEPETSSGDPQPPGQDSRNTAARNAG